MWVKGLTEGITVNGLLNWIKIFIRHIQRVFFKFKSILRLKPFPGLPPMALPDQLIKKLATLWITQSYCFWKCFFNEHFLRSSNIRWRWRYDLKQGTYCARDGLPKGRTLQISQQAKFCYQIDADVPCQSGKQRRETEIKKVSFIKLVFGMG